jgi:single-strand DNA-binding protein
MSFEISGVLAKVYDTESKSQSFQTREFVITTEETYPQFVKFQSVQDRVGIVDGYKEGEKVKVYFDLRGREWQGKYFTNLNAWKIERAAAAAPPANDDSGFPPSNFESFNEDDSKGSGNFNDFGDLPF